MTTQPNSPWRNEAVVTALREMCAEKLFISDIAKELSARFRHKFTRNAVIGAMHSLGISNERHARERTSRRDSKQARGRSRQHQWTSSPARIKVAQDARNGIAKAAAAPQPAIKLSVQPIIVTVKPNGHSTRCQLFDAFVNDRPIGRRSPMPLLDACRVLLADGVDPATRVVMRHSTRADLDALRSTVGAAAKLTVKQETEDGKPRFVKWQPNSYRGGVPGVLGEPPMRQTEVAAIPLA